MERDKEAVPAGQSGHGGATGVRSLYPAMTLCLPSAAANEDESWIEVDLMTRDASISVWWDRPPSADL